MKLPHQLGCLWSRLQNSEVKEKEQRVTRRGDGSLGNARARKSRTLLRRSEKTHRSLHQFPKEATVREQRQNTRISNRSRAGHPQTFTEGSTRGRQSNPSRRTEHGRHCW